LVCNSKDGKCQAGAEIYWTDMPFLSIFGQKSSIKRYSVRWISITFYFHIMKVHPKFMWITFGNFVACFITFYFLDWADKDDRQTVGINLFIGWIFWLGIFSLIAPLFFSDEERDVITDSPYMPGTIMMCVVNLVGTIFCCYYASTFFPFRES